jgi:hypothetical protein
MRTAKEPAPSGLSVTTLAIASVSSIAAAVVIHKFWKGGAILGAGLTPVIVAIVSETLRKPTRAITSIRTERRDRSRVARRTPDGVPTAPPPELERADPFGIWQESTRPSAWDRIKGRPLKIALATGVAAFAIGALLVTGTQLVLGDGGGGDGGGGGSRLIYVPGEKKSTSEKDKTGTQTTETQTTETVPPAEEETPTETVPQETTPTIPQTTPTVPPSATPPAATAPAPTETTPVPTTPVPTPAPGTPPAG